MKTARQSGWSLMCSDMVGNAKFVTLNNESGDYLELRSFEDGQYALNSFNTGISIFDLPQSVLDLCALWLGISIPFERKLQ